jgi:mono/diheme cytochrome c family protein
MRKLLIGLGALMIVLLVVAGAGLVYFYAHYPNVGPAPAIRVEMTPQRIERGRYLANHVTACIDCHSTRNWSYFSGPIVPGTEGKGGERFGEDLGFPGTFYSTDITPAGIGDRTDGEIIRTITSGVTRSRRAMFPVMPYLSYCRLSEDDVEAVVAYIRTLQPVPNDIPVPRLDFPMNLIVRTIPQPCPPRPSPDRGNSLTYGEYLITIGACAECHTPIERGEPVKGMDYAGGREFPVPRGGMVRSANITPDLDTGIGRWSRDFFIAKFHNFTSDEHRQIPVAAGEFNTFMPWTMYAGMTDEDLGDMYVYLWTVKPVKNPIDKFSPAR